MKIMQRSFKEQVSRENKIVKDSSPGFLLDEHALRWTKAEEGRGLRISGQVERVTDMD